MKNILIVAALFLLSCNANNKEETPIEAPSAQEEVKTTPTNDTILLVTMNFEEKELVPVIADAITAYYHNPVKVADAPLPEKAFLSARNRYQGKEIIANLKTLNTNHYRFIAGLTSKDICTKRRGVDDWGIFGLGSLDGSGCISSTCRLKKGVSHEKLTDRIKKVVLHEIGHNHGLHHCRTKNPCFMKDANGSIKVVDNEPMDICSDCKKILKG